MNIYIEVPTLMSAQGSSPTAGGLGVHGFGSGGALWVMAPEYGSPNLRARCGLVCKPEADEEALSRMAMAGQSGN